MASPAPPADPHGIAMADSIARSAHRWVRLSLGMPARIRDPGHLAWLDGLVAGLCAELARGDAAAPAWSRYVYALLDGYGTDALRASTDMQSAGADPALADARQRGYAEGVAIASWSGVPRHLAQAGRQA